MIHGISSSQDKAGITIHPEQVPFPTQVTEALAHFSIAPFRFKLRADTDISLSSYKGSAFRGGFGHSLRRIVCMTKQKDCRACILRVRCLYPYIFETDRPDSDLSSNKSKDIPRPFVLVPPLKRQQTYSRGEGFSCDLILIGKVIENLPYFICTMETMGEQGLGKGHGRFIVEHAEFLHPDRPPYIIYYAKKLTLTDMSLPLTGNYLISRLSDKTPETITLEFQTPVRLKHDAHLSDRPEFHILFSRLLDRIASLSEHHHGIPLDLDFKELKQLSERVRIKAFNTFWQDWERYSNRQQTRMKLGGLLGTVTYEGNLEPFLPFLTLGEWVHVGKGATFGLGKYRLNF